MQPQLAVVLCVAQNAVVRMTKSLIRAPRVKARPSAAAANAPPCGHRFTTYEEVEHEGLMVLKRDGRREEFSREKLLSGIRKACQKRPVSLKAMDDLVDHIVAVVTEKFENEVPGEFIGKMVMDGLRGIGRRRLRPLRQRLSPVCRSHGLRPRSQKTGGHQMIALQSDCLIFQLTNGESVPCSAEMISIEIVGNSDGLIDAEMLRHAAASVFHYFKCETRTRDRHRRRIRPCARKSPARSRPDALRRRTRHRAGGRTSRRPISAASRANPPTTWNCFSSRACATNLRTQLRQSPRVLRFRGLRGCVKQLAGARRWSARCEKMQEQIVEFLRECLTAEPEQKACALVVE